MSIQSNVNSILGTIQGAATTLAAGKAIGGIRKDLKESSKDIKGSIESLKMSKADREGYEGYNKAMTNPNIRKIILSQQDVAVKKALMNEKFKQSLMERAQTLAKQKQDVPKIKEELRLGKEKIDPTSPLYQKIMSQMEEKDGK